MDKEKRRNVQAEFYPLLREYFFKGKEIDEEMLLRFKGELDTLDLLPEEILFWFMSYLAHVLIGDKNIFFAPDPEIPQGKRPYDWALEVYMKGFGAIFDKLFESRPGYEVDGIRKQDYLAFLCGINHDFYSDDYRIRGNYHNMSESSEPILITGETGTGKELHAKLFHYLSGRKNEKLLALNCSGIPESLLESQLFGYAKGAFTGAAQPSEGILQGVGEGTLFLDEIGDMSLNLQAKILRVLETGDYYRVGEYKKPLFFKGRIIAATNKNLEAEILKDEPHFRPDLYYRVSVFNIKLKPFRDLPIEVRRRKLDYMLMQQVYRHDIVERRIREEKLSEKSGMGARYFNYKSEQFLSEDAEALLLQYNYPGNYREMINILKSSLLNSGGSVTVDFLPDSVRNYNPVEAEQFPKMTRDPFQVENVKMKDILDYAESVRQTIVEKKIEQLYRNGKDLKNVLRSEGVVDQKDYNNIYGKISRIVNRDRLKALRYDAKKNKIF